MEALNVKKLICMILAIVLAAGCVGSLAEGASSSEDSKFLQIKEGVTAPVFADPKDETPVDQLEGGTLCCAVGDPFTSANKEFLLIFYLNSQKKGTLGYIAAEDAQVLTEQELAKLMENPEKLNEVLDLVDALDEYFKDNNETAAAATSGSNGSAVSSNRSLLGDLYDQAMNSLAGIFSSDVANDLADAAQTVAKDAAEVVSEKFAEAKKAVEGKLKEAQGTLEELGKTAGEKFDEAKKAVEENWPAVEKKAGEILDAAKDKVEEILPGAEKKVTDVLDGVKEKYDAFKEDPDAFLEDLKTDVTEGLEKLDVSSGNAAGSLLDTVAGLSNELEDLVNSDTFTLVKNAIPAFAENYRDQGFSKGTESLVNTVKLVIDLMNQSSSGDN